MEVDELAVSKGQSDIANFDGEADAVNRNSGSAVDELAVSKGQFDITNLGKVGKGIQVDRRKSERFVFHPVICRRFILVKILGQAK